MESFPWRKALGLLLILFLAIMFFESMDQVAKEGGGPPAPVPYSVLKAEVRKNNVKKVKISQTELTADLAAPISVGAGETKKDASRISSSLPTIGDPELLPLIEKSGAEIDIVKDEGSGILVPLLLNSLPFLLLIGFWVWTTRRAQQKQMGPFGSFGQVKAKMYDETRPKVTFADVAGLQTQKRELEEIVDFLKNPDKYTKIGGRVPKGVLLVGPPGTGKTLIAKAVAGEAGVPFFSTSASEFIEMFVGVGASRVRDLFARAREKAPSIIFIDEIDAVGRSRGAGLGGGHDEREQTLNQLLGEMDGFEGHERVIIISATNRPDVLDSALLRPGRFDRQVIIDMPTMHDREDMLKVHTRKIPLAPDVELGVLARATPGMSGADLENLCNEAALFAARENAMLVTMRHFEVAKDKVMMGVERPGLMSDAEKKITAYHETGHTLVARLIPGMDPVHKVTILPRGPALGVTQLVPEEDRHYYPKRFLMDRLAVSLGGRAAELLILGDTSTGAQSDLKYCTDLAEKMVCQWGMSERVGPVTFNRGEEHVFLGKKLAQEKTWSEQMGWIIDQEVEAIIRGSEKIAEELLLANRPTLERLAMTLLEREELTGDEVDLVIKGETLPPKAPPFVPPPPPEEPKAEGAPPDASPVEKTPETV
jgi:cell division protease FtsH